MKKHCCDTMDYQINEWQCDIHKDRFDCPDALISYSEKFNEYGLIIHDGGRASSMISFCPYCGTKLPDSKRELWFDTLERLGFDDPSDQEIPKEFLSSEWYNKSQL